jgi:aspartate ammonia-lyase
MSSAASFRVRKRPAWVPLKYLLDAYYGIQTLRAVNNFHLSGVPMSHYPKLVVGLAMVKQAAADANRELGHLSDAKHAAISEACARLIRAISTKSSWWT